MTYKFKRSREAGMVALLATVFTTGYAFAQDTFTMRLAHHLPLTHVHGIAATKFADAVAENSGGRIKVNVYPAESLLTGREMLGAVSNGTVETGVVSAAFHTGTMPQLNAYLLPFLFDDAAHFHRAVDNGLFDIVQELYEEQNVHMLSYYNKGETDVFDADEVMLTPEAFVGKNLRGIGGYMTRALGMFGASAVTLPVGEVNSALERGVVSGVATSCESTINRGWSEVADHMTVIRLSQSGEGIGVNMDWWNSLPEDLQTVLTDAATDAADFAWATMEETDTVTCPAKWKELGYEAGVVTPEEKKAFRAKVQDLYAEAEKELPVYDRVMEIVEATR